MHSKRSIMEINIDKKKMILEFNHIKNDNRGYETGTYWNEIVLNFQWKEFYKKEIELWNTNPIFRGVPLRSYIYSNRLKYIGKSKHELTDREILRAFKIIGIHFGYSFHSPFWIKQFIKDYEVRCILDPCGGWGHRMLGASTDSNITYIYNDINTNTYRNCKDMADYFNMSNVIFYNKDASELRLKENYDCIFTCPPYHNLEIYSNDGAENLPYLEFKYWWKSVIANALHKGLKYIAFVINEKYKQDLSDMIKDYAQLDKEIPLGSSTQLHHFNKVTGKPKEQLIVFKL